MDVIEFYRIVHAVNPLSVWTAPGGINLLGHYAPYTRGFALAMTLSPQVQVAYGPRYDGRIVARTTDDQTMLFDIDLANWDPYAFYGPVGRQVATVVHAYQSAGKQVRGANLVLGYDALPFAGDLWTLTANGMSALLAQVLCHTVRPVCDPAEIARLAHRANAEIEEWPTGLIEQLASVFGKEKHALLTDWNDFSARPVPLDLARNGLSMLIMNLSGVAGVFEGVNDAKRRICSNAEEKLGRDLREFTGTDVSPILEQLGANPQLRAMVRHVVNENTRVWRVAGQLQRGDHPRLLGPELTASHASLRDDYGLLVPEAETVVTAALGAGAHGARITGGPSEAWVVALADTDATASVSDAVNSALIDAGYDLGWSFSALPTDGVHATYPPPDPF